MTNIIRGDVPAGVVRPSTGYLRALHTIASDAYLRYNNALRCWEVWKDLVTTDEDDHGVVTKRTVPLLRAVFNEINERALDNLRFRRWVGDHFSKDRETYLRWLLQESQEARAIEKQRTIDRIAEEAVKTYKIERSHSINLGGSHGSLLRVDG